MRDASSVLALLGCILAIALPSTSIPGPTGCLVAPPPPPGLSPRLAILRGRGVRWTRIEAHQRGGILGRKATPLLALRGGGGLLKDRSRQKRMQRRKAVMGNKGASRALALPREPGVSKRDAITEYVKRKRLKQHRRNIRKNREEIEESKEDSRETLRIASILFNAYCKDNETFAQLTRLKNAMDEYKAGVAKDPSHKPALMGRLIQAFQVPPRSRDAEIMGDGVCDLDWDFEPTRENIERRRKLRKELGLSKGKTLFLQMDPDFKRDLEHIPDEDIDSEDYDYECSAPDIDRLTYLEPSIFKCPEGDRENPHREKGPAQEFLKAIGANVECQTSREINDEHLAIDPLEEGNFQSREELEDMLMRVRRKMKYRWALTDERYMAMLKREEKRLVILIPHSRPNEIPPEEWLPPREVEAILRDGPYMFPKPKFEPGMFQCKEDEDLYDAWRQELVELRSVQEELAIKHYKRLLKEGRVPPPEKLTKEEREEETEREEIEREGRERQAEEDMDAARDEASALGASMDDFDQIASLGYNGTEALSLVRWAARQTHQGGAWLQQFMHRDNINMYLGGDASPAPERGCKGGVEVVPGGLGWHYERVHLSPSPLNTANHVEDRVDDFPCVPGAMNEENDGGFPGFFARGGMRPAHPSLVPRHHVESFKKQLDLDEDAVRQAKEGRGGQGGAAVEAMEDLVSKMRSGLKFYEKEQRGKAAEVKRDAEALRGLVKGFLLSKKERLPPKSHATLFEHVADKAKPWAARSSQKQQQQEEGGKQDQHLSGFYPPLPSSLGSNVTEGSGVVETIFAGGGDDVLDSMLDPDTMGLVHQLDAQSKRDDDSARHAFEYVQSLTRAKAQHRLDELTPAEVKLVPIIESLRSRGFLKAPESPAVREWRGELKALKAKRRQLMDRRQALKLRHKGNDNVGKAKEKAKEKEKHTGASGGELSTSPSLEDKVIRARLEKVKQKMEKVMADLADAEQGPGGGGVAIQSNGAEDDGGVQGKGITAADCPILRCLITSIRKGMEEKSGGGLGIRDGELCEWQDDWAGLGVSCQGALLDDPPTVHRDYLASHLMEFTNRYAPQHTKDAHRYLVREYANFSWYRECPRGVYAHTEGVKKVGKWGDWGTFQSGKGAKGSPRGAGRVGDKERYSFMSVVVP